MSDNSLGLARESGPRPTNPPRRSITIQSAIVLVVIGTVLFVSTVTLAGVLWINNHSARNAARDLFGIVATRVEEGIRETLRDALQMADAGVLLTDWPGDAPGNARHDALVQLIIGHPTIYSAYLGGVDGTFVQVINARRQRFIIDAHGAPSRTWVMLRWITGEGEARVEDWTYLDQDLQILGGRRDPASDYDPRERPWFSQARADGGTVLSRPYIFHSLGRPGLTAARRLLDGSGVFGVDISLQGLQTIVENLPVSRSGGVAVFDADNRLLALSPTLGSASDGPRLQDSGTIAHRWLAAFESGDGMDEGIVRSGNDMLVHARRWEASVGSSFTILVLAPWAEFDWRGSRTNLLIVAVGLITVLVALPIAFVGARRMSGTIRELASDAERIQSFDFSGNAPDHSNIREINDLAVTFAQMKHEILSNTDALRHARDRLARLVDLGIALTAEHDPRALMDRVVREAMDMTGADGGTLYRLDESALIQFEVIHNTRLAAIETGSARDDVGAGMPTLPPVPRFDAAGAPNHRHVVSHAVNTGRTINVQDAYDAAGFDFSGTRAWDRIMEYRSHSILTVPMAPPEGPVIGALQLINARDDAGAIIAFSDASARLVEALAAQAAVSVHNATLGEDASRLLGSLRRANRDLEEARHDALAASALKSQLMSLFSHEFRTPLNVILGFADFMYGPSAAELDLPQVEVQRFGNEIRKAARDMLEMINDLLSLIDINMNNLKLQRQIISPDSLILIIMQRFQEACLSRNIQLSWEGVTSELRIDADPMRLMQALFNVVSNSVKYTPEGGAIRLGITAGIEGGCTLWVEDTGPGIPLDVVARVTEPFYQARGSMDRRESDSGLGLGLTITNAITEAHGGNMSIGSATGGGARVALEFPTVAAVPDTAANSSKSAAAK